MHHALDALLDAAEDGLLAGVVGRRRLAPLAHRSREQRRHRAVGPAADLVEPFLSPARVARYHVHFPDPWPKKHHARYRLVEPTFARALAASVAPGGAIVLATDSPEYAVEIHAAFSVLPELRSAHPDPGWIKTAKGARATVFEERWRAMGREINALRYDKPS